MHLETLTIDILIENLSVITGVHAIVLKNCSCKTTLDTPTKNEESQKCQRKVLRELRVIDVLTEH